MDEFQIKIKYKDLKLGEYRISLEDFAKSLSGYSNVLSIVGTYSVSGRIEEKPENWIVDVVTTVPPFMRAFPLPYNCTAIIF